MSHDDVMREFRDLIVQQARMDPVIAVAMGDQGYVMRHSDAEPVIDAAKRIQEVRPD
jgi:hypothetical protein